MGKTAAAEVITEEKVTVPFEFKRTVPPGSKVTLEYQIVGAKGWQQVALTENAGVYSMQVEMDEGSRFRYRFRIEKSGSKVVEAYPVGKPGYIESEAKAGPEKSPSATAPLHDVRTTVEKGIARVFERSQTEKGAKELPVELRALEHRLKSILKVGEDITPMFLSVIGDVIRSDKKWPAEIRNKFPENSPPQDFDEVQKRLEEGGREFREHVFQELLRNEDARKAFGLKEDREYDDANPLGNAAANKLFLRVCNTKSLGAIAPALKDALAPIANVPAIDPALAAQRQAMLPDILSRLPADKQKTFMDEIPTKRKAATLDMLVNLGVPAAVIFGPLSFGAGAAILGSKMLVEMFGGVSTKEVMEAWKSRDGRVLWDSIKRNNLARNAVTAKVGMFESMKMRLKEVFARAIPGYGLKFSGESIGGFKTPESKAGDRLGLIQKAAEAALK